MPWMIRVLDSLLRGHPPGAAADEPLAPEPGAVPPRRRRPRRAAALTPEALSPAR